MRRFREHRGSLEESMKTVVYITTLSELVLHLLAIFPDVPIQKLRKLTIKPYGGVDPRTGWNMHIVESTEAIGVLGFTDGMP